MDKAVKHVQNGLGGLWNSEQKLMVLQEWQVPGWIKHYNRRRRTAPWASIFVQFFRFIDQLRRDLGTLGFPLSQRDTPGLQNRFLFRACGYHQIIMHGLSHLKRFHTVPFCRRSLISPRR